VPSPHENDGAVGVVPRIREMQRLKRRFQAAGAAAWYTAPV
jgi:hypothetical protein